MAVEVAENVALPAGTAWHFRIVASTAGGTVAGVNMTFATPLSAWQLWQDGQFGSHSGPGTGPADDPDGDSLPNAIEHALGSSPVFPAGNTGMPVPEMYTVPESGITYASMIYRPADDAPGVTLAAEASDNLTVWQSATVTVIDLPGGYKRAVALGLERFLRLKATVNP
jgi:hypothetical protein